MISDKLDELQDYPFWRMNALVEGIPLPDGHDSAIPMWIGEPKHGVPEIARAALSGSFEGYGIYPPIEGTPGLRRTMAGWLNRRYGLPEGLIDPDKAILPVQGTREGLFMIALAAVPREKAGKQPIALLPNPFYQPYKGGAVTSGAEPVFLACPPQSNFLPDLDSLTPEILDRTAIFYLCSPTNPQGTVADLAYYRRAVDLARRHDFLLVSDECYAEIYDRDPPAGVMQICAQDGNLSNVVCFHSLSKRSSVPGLRHGFVAGDPDFLTAFLRLRKYAAASSSMAQYAAAEVLWSDEEHVAENRRLYREKIDIAERSLGNRFGFFRPPGGFFLWLDVGDGIEAAKRLWAEAAVKVLPGRYLAEDNPDGSNDATRYIRVALVNDLESTRTALTRIAATL
ncbi:MAG: aminotransferase class I/II-fold pyridoxal phosphate-dependent enzyme [Alphaproteobacteria bacterium]|jgi:N-succinyldiaminopimelate aminotransferase|nr:aminotransferase class I/II-fold pyridoxal phosphate-dependent enzyme [Rhodospirillaceae bacterium]MBT6206012.1 aminotransferase class I/II-fold pyridoxal phosphate-dependent enzyme [Rhodospirillaceae bacterium]MBT6510971.1 aminotransferase class I/II-fold pyridoxal phosphate-dependent enzyme [Rhodospirillaceae bacterium]MBT7646292.1 aminotransferase class I/II-fold pyridoxal phosphate-dependent enzyme [Rhodospirillaceae bacterium]MDG2483308.1 aminotransferase class I/II-fold pyridoxal phosp